MTQQKHKHRGGGRQHLQQRILHAVHAFRLLVEDQHGGIAYGAENAVQKTGDAETSAAPAVHQYDTAADADKARDFHPCQRQGLYAIGSGGLFGKGLGESLQKLGFVPEAQNDMIFSIICEELGLFGAISVILIFMFMIYRFMVIAGNAPDLMGAMIVIGVMAHIAIQVILNIAVVTNTIPNTGVTLPFISYGGTSVMFLMLEMGMVLSVSNQIKLEQ